MGVRSEYLGMAARDLGTNIRVLDLALRDPGSTYVDLGTEVTGPNTNI